jgi:hypothetical protein
MTGAASKKDLLTPLEEMRQAIDAEVVGESEGGFELVSLPNKEHESLHSMASALTALAAIVESADTAPSEDASAAAAKWQEAAGNALSLWQNLLQQKLSHVNSLLQQQHLEPLSPSK